ncbi:MAG: TlpA disulfide reductase family protein [Alphaproteobacteria bacterium]
MTKLTMIPIHTGPHRALQFLFGMAILVIVAISPHLASAQANKCAKPVPELAHMEAVNKPAPMAGTPFYDAGGRPIDIADYKGRGVVLNFWATWCVPCVKEMPALSRLKQKLAASGIEVLALSIDRAGAKIVKKFLKINKIDNLDILIDKKSAVLRKSSIIGLPTTLLIDPDGIVRGRVQGIAEWDDADVVGFLKRCIGPDA